MFSRLGSRSLQYSETTTKLLNTLQAAVSKHHPDVSVRVTHESLGKNRHRIQVKCERSEGGAYKRVLSDLQFTNTAEDVPRLQNVAITRALRTRYPEEFNTLVQTDPTVRKILWTSEIRKRFLSSRPLVEELKEFLEQFTSPVALTIEDANRHVLSCTATSTGKLLEVRSRTACPEMEYWDMYLQLLHRVQPEAHDMWMEAFQQDQRIVMARNNNHLNMAVVLALLTTKAVLHVHSEVRQALHAVSVSLDTPSGAVILACESHPRRRDAESLCGHQILKEYFLGVGPHTTVILPAKYIAEAASPVVKQEALQSTAPSSATKENKFANVQRSALDVTLHRLHVKAKSTFGADAGLTVGGSSEFDCFEAILNASSAGHTYLARSMTALGACEKIEQYVDSGKPMEEACLPPAARPNNCRVHIRGLVAAELNACPQEVWDGQQARLVIGDRVLHCHGCVSPINALLLCYAELARQHGLAVDPQFSPLRSLRRGNLTPEETLASVVRHFVGLVVTQDVHQSDMGWVCVMVGRGLDSSAIVLGQGRYPTKREAIRISAVDALERHFPAQFRSVALLMKRKFLPKDAFLEP